MSPEPGPRPYPQVAPQADYPAIEEEVLAFWAEDGTFEASVEGRPADQELVFYDGPPFANGLPHYGHLLTSFVKDAMPRYHTMRGRRVERRFGWDCHGLPAETEAEKELGVSGRGPITELGIDVFNDYCRTSVLRYTRAWERYVTRAGRWVDFGNDYKTMDLPYMESVIWAFAQLHERGLIYEDYRVLPYCWECETPLSNFETRQDDAYRERVDPAVTVLFDLLPAADPGSSGLPDAGAGAGADLLDGPLRVLVWTTTPWTLPSNLALAVGADLDYAVLQRSDDRVVVGASRLEAYAAELEGATLLGTVRGAELVGRAYRPLFDYFAATDGAFVVLAGDFVTTDEGTGVVHMAPGFGEDDQRACAAAGIGVICPVDSRGCFDETVPDLAGKQVFDANALIIERLAGRGALLRAEEYAHSYPHCWRTDTPLIYRAVSSFFVKVTAFKDRLVELNHEQVRFVPEHVRDGAFGKWLEGARDWSITRNRFWGTPIPVWKSDDPTYPRIDVYGSLEALEADFGVRPSDLHRPAIDELTRTNPDDPTGRSTMRRVPDVLDCWFDSGSMPYAQLHYPFENAGRFEAHFPADFICEYVGQTRGWFYNLHVLATALFDRPAFSNCIAHGVLLGNDGRKLSKRLRNYPDPEEFFAEAGADTMRWYLLSSAVLRGQDVVIEAKAMTEPVRQVLNPIWNSWYFLSLYGGTDGLRGHFRTDQQGLLDRYLLAKTRQLLEHVTAAFDEYDLPAATTAIAAFLDALTNWYVRRSRERFWRPLGTGAAEDADKTDAYDTLHTVLTLLCQMAAPLLPFLTEEVYRGITGERSVHLSDWPDPAGLPHDPDLVESMDLVRAVCSAAHSVRKSAGLRARLPLASLCVAAPGASRLAPFTDLIAEEINVKRVDLTDDLSAHASRALAVLPAALGPRLGPRTQQVIGAVRRGEWEQSPDGVVTAGGEQLEPGEYALRLQPVDAKAGRTLPGDTAVIVLDLDVSEPLEAEGLARDLVRLVQQARKDAGLHVSDRIELALDLAGGLVGRLERWEPGASPPRFVQEVAAQTLATSMLIGNVQVAGRDASGGAAAGPDTASGDWFITENDLGAKSENAGSGTVAIRLRKAAERASD